MNVRDWKRICEFADYLDIHNHPQFSVEHRDTRNVILYLDELREANSLWRSGLLSPETKLVLAKAWKHVSRPESEWECIQCVQMRMFKLQSAIQDLDRNEERETIRGLASFEDILEMMVQEVASEQLETALAHLRGDMFEGSPIC